MFYGVCLYYTACYANPAYTDVNFWLNIQTGLGLRLGLYAGVSGRHVRGTPNVWTKLPTTYDAIRKSKRICLRSLHKAQINIIAY